MARFFQKVNMESEDVNAKMRSGIYQVGSTNTAVSSGAFVTVTGLADNTTYASSGVKDLNKLIVKAPVTATTAKGIYVTDIVKVTDGTIAGNVYREGVKTIGLSAIAGESVALRNVNNYTDQFLLGDENFVGGIAGVGTNSFAVLTNGSVDLTPSATIPATGFTVAIDQKMTVSQGITGNVTAYLCRVVQL